MLADLILYAHATFVAFVVLGALCIVLGKWFDWAWTRNAPFRIAHLAAIAFVALQTLLGFACPLTVWEFRLRGMSTEGPGFIALWVQRLLYYDLPEWVFTLVYTAFGAFVFFLYRWSPPRFRKH